MAKQTFTSGQVLTAAQMTSLQQTAMGGGSPVAKTASYVLVAADAGTVIQMNNAGATTITVNTGLFSAGDTVFLQNIGAGASTITAGTATVTTAGSLALTQWEGGTLYFTSSSAAIFFDYIQAGTTLPLTTKGDLFGYDTTNARIPIGTNGQVLTADSTQALGLKWASAASASASWTLINSGGTSLSGSTTTISSISGYNQLAIYVGSAQASAINAQMSVNFNGDTAANYNSFGWYDNIMSTYTPTEFHKEVAGGLTGCFMGYNNVTGCRTNGGVLITGANTTNHKYFDVIGSSTYVSGNNSAAYWLKGWYQNSTTISSVSVRTQAGTFTGGTVYVYGSAN